MIDDATALPDGSPLEADICIAGAGAAGIALALELIDSGLSVLLLESGGWKMEDQTQNLYAGQVADTALHSPPDRYRQRRFGGSTVIWGGRCVPYDDIDFERRDWIAHSGWPLTLAELLPWYQRANTLCEAGPYAYRVGDTFSSPQPPMLPGYASTRFSSDGYERFSRPTNFAARYGSRLRHARNVRVLLHANLCHLQLDSSGHELVSATVRCLDGRSHSLRAQRYVLATGGLEVPRLLLASRDVAPQGIGNAHDVVGRYYQCHLAGTIGLLSLDPKATVVHGYDLSPEGVYCRRRIQPTPALQREQRLANFVARLHFPRITDPAHRTGILSLLYLAKFLISYEYGKRLHGEEKLGFGTWLAHVRNVVMDPFYTASFLWHWLWKRTLAARKFPSVIIRNRGNRFSLDFNAEQQPNPHSRVTLLDETDALGVPRIHVDWRYTPEDVDALKRTFALFAEDVQRCGIGRFSYDPDSVETEMTRYGAYGGHHIGTARMGTDPRDSVVDCDCRVHGVSNLYIASSAVFPTSSHANPTLTIVALALRLAAQLRMELGAELGAGA